MSTFGIIGPVMIGPSSSHTAGAVRIGLVARALLGERPVSAAVGLHGSFQKTFRGHGTDKAIVGGLLGYAPDDPRIRDSLRLAEEQGLRYAFEPVDIANAHPNTVRLALRGESGRTVSVLARSVGAGNILVEKIDEIEVSFTGQYHTLVVMHPDVPGKVAAVTSLLSEEGINIAQMRVYRSSRRGKAVTVIESDQPGTEALVRRIRSLPDILSVTLVPALQ